jgi:phenylpropionate dioxygenase-like ring-hydroxylating dioxygenase large terminal subunit
MRATRKKEERPRRYPFPATPDGWFALARSEEIASGATAVVSALGSELRITRDAQGRASIAGGVSCEANGFVYAWYHASGAPPSYQVARYREDESAWTPWRSSAYCVRVHVQDMTENILDRAHFTSVHDMALPEREHFDVRFEGASLVVDQLMRVTAVNAAGVDVRSRTTTNGPGLVAVEVKQGPLDMLTYITQTPRDDERCDVSLHFSMRRLADAAATARIAELNERITRAQFEQDVPIWEHKCYRARPALADGDGPVAEYRRWFRQFYSTWDGAGACEEGR